MGERLKKLKESLVITLFYSKTNEKGFRRDGLCMRL